VGSVVDGGGGDLFKWIEINKRNNSNTTTKREDSMQQQLNRED
jgi:hypothetical protein